MKSETGIVVYNWAYQCPRCKAVMTYDFNKSLWAFECGGLGVDCDNCGKFGQVITKKDVEEAVLISPEDYSKLEFFEKVTPQKSIQDYVRTKEGAVIKL